MVQSICAPSLLASQHESFGEFSLVRKISPPHLHENPKHIQQLMNSHALSPINNGRFKQLHFLFNKCSTMDGGILPHIISITYFSLDLRDSRLDFLCLSSVQSNNSRCGWLTTESIDSKINRFGSLDTLATVRLQRHPETTKRGNFSSYADNIRWRRNKLRLSSSVGTLPIQEDDLEITTTSQPQLLRGTSESHSSDDSHFKDRLTEQHNEQSTPLNYVCFTSSHLNVSKY